MAKKEHPGNGARTCRLAHKARSDRKVQPVNKAGKAHPVKQGQPEHPVPMLNIANAQSVLRPVPHIREVNNSQLVALLLALLLPVPYHTLAAPAVLVPLHNIRPLHRHQLLLRPSRLLAPMEAVSAAKLLLLLNQVLPHTLVVALAVLRHTANWLMLPHSDVAIFEKETKPTEQKNNDKSEHKN